MESIGDPYTDNLGPSVLADSSKTILGLTSVFVFPNWVMWDVVTVFLLFNKNIVTLFR